MVRRCIALLVAAVFFTFPSFAENDTPVWTSFSKSDGVYARVETSDKVIALTFDDGPHPILTPKILDILDKYDVKATFFVVGEMAKSYPSSLKKVAKNGHEIGNHTFTHLQESENGCERLKSEILETENTVFKLTGKKTFLFRPPTGYCCSSAVTMTKELGYTTVVWDIDTRDWAHPSPTQILSEVKKYARSGSIILFHDFIGKDSPTPKALELIIPWLIANGYKLVTVGELIGMDTSA
jgi:peptidoglycan/xylan/chitin deacetylase (PgdA/CDA1 family)